MRGKARPRASWRATEGVKKAPRPRIWSSKEADKKFSEWVRQRDKMCVRCGFEHGRLTCSHFYSRVRSSTRYDPDNCDSLAWLPCHYQWEHEKQGDYRDFKIKQLGQERYDALMKRAKTLMPRKEAILQLMSWLK